MASIVRNPDLLCTAEACGHLAISRAQLFRLLRKDDRFPRPIRLGSRTLRFRKRELDVYMGKVQR